MNKHKLFNLFVIMAMLAGLLTTPAMAARPADKEPPPPESKEAPPPPEVKAPAKGGALPATPAEKGANPLDKLYPSLRELALTAGPSLPKGMQVAGAAKGEPVLVNLIATLGAQDGATTLVDLLKPYFVNGQLYGQPPLGKDKMGSRLQVLFGRILPYNLVKVASFAQVVRIYPIEAERQEYEPYPADEPKEKAEIGPEQWAALRAKAAQTRGKDIPWSQARAFGDGRTRPPTEDWFEVSPQGPHKAEAAWARGYTGEGVAISVIDDGVDMAHPDLMGTQRIYNSAVAPQYNGWPMVMDPFTMRAYFYDRLFGTNYIAGSFGGSTYVDTSATPPLTPCGPGVSCFQYTPMIAYNVPGLLHTYLISSTMSKSGVVHVGTHTDESLRDYVWGEKVAVLVADPNTAGVYDTVYVDLDDDYDFRDEKPATRANPANPATYNDPIIYRDMTGDGLADLSGGMLYWIADGANWVPGMDWLFVPTLGFGLTPPGPGELVAIHGPWDSGYSHGTQCASNAVANGVINGMLPKFRDLPPYPGTPPAAVYGAAPDADMVPMNTAWSFAGRISYNDAYILAAIGWDGVDQTGWHFLYGPGYSDTDDIQITSNSYGWSADDNDGWDFLGQYIWQIQRYYAPYLQFLFSTGNGAPGYGTSAPPSPGLGVMVGSSTEYGSTGWDTITDTTQINFNDYTAFSNGGPAARAGAGVDVLANGSFAAGDEELNYYPISTWGVLDGDIAWATWGGTSRSSPTAMGNFALIYQAYKARHGVWPTADQARALLMSSATDINNNVLKQGAGAVNADRGTLVAGGHYGVYMGGDSATWEPGDYRGTLYPGFAQVVQPGGTYTKAFTVHNDSPAPINVTVADQALTLISTRTLALTVTPAMVAAESVYGAANRDNFYKAFQYFIPITAGVGNDASWYNVAIPPDTDLMVVRQIFPYDEFDVGGDYVWDQRYYLVVYNWTDEDGDGKVWDDKNANGVVNFINGTDWTSVDVGPELAWTDPRTELDRWEYERFGYNRPTANSNELTVQDPLNRMHDGMFIGLRHLFTSRGAAVTTHLKYRIEFYKKADVPWLSTSVGPLTVPAGGTATFTGLINVPPNMPPGDYEAAIEVYDPGPGIPGGPGPHTTVIPVVMNVAATFAGGALTLGGQASYAYDANNPYNNAALRGYQDWGWREESGDWRFFYVDVENEPTATPLLSENFDGVVPPALPVGWYAVDVSGTAGNWATNAGTVHPSGYAAHSASNLAYFNSWTASSGNSTRLWYTGTLDLSAASAPELTFWMFHDGQYSNNDTVQPQVSTDGGATWTNVGPAIPRYIAGSWYWQQYTVDLSGYIGQPDVRIGFLGTSAYGNDCHIDDVAVVDYVYPIPPDSHVIVRDVWDPPAPRNDIDTVVLGPSPTGLTDVNFGAWGGDWSEPPFYGPYVLDPIAKSAVDRIGRATWRFNTTSGKNEDWVTFPIASSSDPNGGLHRILQHDVLFDGSQFDVVFTKTLGTLIEDKHSFFIDTYVDAGLVGTVTLKSSLALNGLTAEGYLIGVDEQVWTDEPIGFVSPDDIEWFDVFTVQDGVDIELWLDSADVPDLDLFLFQRVGSSWQQRGSSTGSTASEHIYYANPGNGQWLVGIVNYSGPAGHFDLTRVVRTKVPAISIHGLPTGAIAADTPVSLGIYYDYAMTPGMCYDGMVMAGPPEAPQLKQIPITICRLRNILVEKWVDYEVGYPAQNLKYTIKLTNPQDPAASLSLADPIPANTNFVSVQTMFHPCPNPLVPGPVLYTQNFDGVATPNLPGDWAVVDVNGTAGNWATNAGTVHPSGQPSHSALNLAYFNSYNASSGSSSRLYRTVGVSLAGASSPRLYFWVYHDTGYDTSQDRVQPQVSTDGGVTWIDLGAPVMRYQSTAGWAEYYADLTAYAGQTDVRIAFLGISGYGNDVHIDDVRVQDYFCPTPGAYYDAGSNSVRYNGPLAVVTSGGPEGFEGGAMPPPGWSTQHLGTTTRAWTLVNAATYPDFVHSGNWAAWVNYDSSNPSDEWLFSDPFMPVAGDSTASFWAYSDTQYPGATMKVWALDQFSATLLWDLIADETWDTAEYRLVTLDLSAFQDQMIRLAWQYVGLDGESFGLDDVYLPTTLLPGATIEVVVRVTDTVASGVLITNTAVVSATHVLPQGNQTEEVEDDAVTRIAEGPNMSTSYKEATETVEPGGQIEYQVHVINTGESVAFVTLTDPIPANTTYAWHDSNPPYQHFGYNDVDDQMEWSGFVAPGEEFVFTFGVDVDPDVVAGDIVHNAARITWDRSSQELEADTQVIQPDLVISKSGPAWARPGETITYKLSYANVGSADAQDVTISDTLPVSMTANVTTWNIGVVGAGMTGTIEFTATLDAGIACGALITNQVSISASNAESNTDNNSGAAQTRVPCYGVELAPETDAASGKPGAMVTYTLRLTNTGDVQDTFDLGQAGNVWLVDLPVAQLALAAGEGADVLVHVTVPSDAAFGASDAVTITATSQGDPAQSDESLLTTSAEAVYGVTLEPPTGAASGDPGEMVTYTLRLTNTGNASDTFDLSAAGCGWTAQLPVTQIPLAAGAGADVLVHVTVAADAAAGASCLVTVTATSQGDAALSDVSRLTTVANTKHGVEITPAAAQSGEAGTRVAYTLRVTNTGNVADWFVLSYSGNAWSTQLAERTIYIDALGSVEVVVYVYIPADAEPGDQDVVTITARSQGDSTQSDSGTLTTSVPALNLFTIYLPIVSRNAD